MIRLGDRELVLEEGPLATELLQQTPEDLAANVYRLRVTQDVRFRWRPIEEVAP